MSADNVQAGHLKTGPLHPGDGYAGNGHPSSQPGQRALRLVPLPAEGSPAAPFLPPPPASPTLRRLQRDLEAARSEANSLRELLEELPAILERKFQLRLHALLAEQRQLEQDNAVLHHNLMLLLSGSQGPLNEPQALAAGSETSPWPTEREDSPITRGLGLRRALRLRHL